MTFDYKSPTALIHAEALSTTLTRLYYDHKLFSRLALSSVLNTAKDDFGKLSKAMGRGGADSLGKDAQEWLDILAELRAHPEVSDPQDIYNAADMLCKAAEKLLQAAEEDLT